MASAYAYILPPNKRKVLSRVLVPAICESISDLGVMNVRSHIFFLGGGGGGSRWQGEKCQHLRGILGGGGEP